MKELLLASGFKPPKNMSSWLERVGGIYRKTDDGGTQRRWFTDRRKEPREETKA